MRLDQHEAQLVLRMTNAFEDRIRQDAHHMRQAAAVLRQGGQVPLFTEGEAGAIAAERLAEDFERTLEDARGLRTRIHTHDLEA